MKIVFLPETLEYFNDLVTILYEKEYFGFEESALNYVDDLINDIKNSLSSKRKKNAPPYFDRFGDNMQYATFKKSKVTQWYVFFTIYQDQGGFTYLIRHISNNHVDAKHLV